MSKNEIELLKRLADLAYKASEEIFDDNDEDGTAGILVLCDQLVEKIDNYVENIKEIKK